MMYDILLVIQTIVVICLIGIILIQRSDSDGFGTGTGGGGNQFMTGRASANLLTRTTAILAAVFIIISLILANMSGQKTSHSIVDAAPSSSGAASPAGTAPIPDIGNAADGLSKLQEKTSNPAPASVPKPE